MRLGTAIIGPGGGVVTSADGRATLTIPPGALGNTETITIESVDPSALPPEFVGANVRQAYKLGPDGTQFAQPVKVGITRADEQPVQADGSLSGTAASLITSSGGALAPLGEPGITLDGSTNTTTVTGLLGHFSYVAMSRFMGGSLLPLQLPKVSTTDLPSEMLVDVPVDVFVVVDISAEPTWADPVQDRAPTASFRHEDSAPLEFMGAQQPILVGTFVGMPGGNNLIETRVGRRVCINSSPLLGKSVDTVEFKSGPSSVQPVWVEYRLEQAVRCTHVLGVLPTVTSVDPTHLATVPTPTAVSVHFSEEMDPSTIRSAFWVLNSAGTAVEGRVEPGPGGDAATFYPAFPLAPGVYHVEVTTVARDMAGEAMGDPFRSTFTTAAATGNTASLSGTTGAVPPVAEPDLPCYRVTGPGPGEKGVFCGGPGTPLLFQLAYDAATLILKSVHVSLEVNGVLLIANVDCASDPASCSRITTRVQGDVIDGLTINDFTAHFMDGGTGQPVGSGRLTAMVERFQF